MTKEELTEIGRKLYGSCWKGKLAHVLGRSRFTVYRWAKEGVKHEAVVKRIRELEQQAVERENI